MRSARSCAATGPAATGALLAVLLLVTGCAGARLARAPEPAVDLSGHWVLEPAASDDAARLIAAAIPKPPARPATTPPLTASAAPETGVRRGGPRSGSGDREATTRTTGAESPPWGRSRAAEFVNAFAMPPALFEIDQRPARIQVGAGARRREFEPGDEQPVSVTDRFGSRRVSAGWQHDEFVITSADGARLKVVEHFRRRPDEHLELLVEFKAQGLKSLSIRSRYRRATDAEIAAASAEGPPPPAGH